MNFDQTQTRNDQSAQFVLESIDHEQRTVEVSFSSEYPVERSFGVEILDHSPGSVVLDRLNSGAAVLVDHKSHDQVGVVVSARVDSDKRGRAVLKFSRSARGVDIFNDVADGIRPLTSVKYDILEYEVIERAGEPSIVRATKWMPFEISIVPIPADPTVGAGRNKTQENIMTDKPEVKLEATSPAPQIDENQERSRIRTEETRRIDSIRSASDRYELDELGRQAISEGWKVDEFNEKALDEVGKRNSQARKDTNFDGEVDLSTNERKNFSLVRLMDAISNPNDRHAQRAAGFELEVSAEAQRGYGSDFKCRGEFIPESLLNGQRDLSAGVSTAGQELVATNLLAGSYIDVLRNASSVMQAGATMLSGLVGNAAIPRQTSGAVASWATSEDANAAESEPTFDQVPLTPKDLRVYTEVTRRLLQQSTPGVENLVRNDLFFAQALGLDAGGLYGTAANGQPRGLVNQTGVNNFNLAAADPTYAEIIQMIREVMADNAMFGNPTFIIDAFGWEALSTTSKQASGVEGNFILGDSGRISGYPYIMSNQVTQGDYFFGDFSQMLIGEWGGVELNVDPYSNSLSGKVRYVIFKTADIAVRHPAAFCYVNDGA